MFENITKFFKKITKRQNNSASSKDTAKERLHLVLMQDRANVSADFLDLMRQEIIDVIKKYIEIDESAIDVRLTNKENEDGTNGAPALYANIPILSIKEEAKKEEVKIVKEKKKNEKANKPNEEPADNNNIEVSNTSEVVAEKIDNEESKEEENNNSIDDTNTVDIEALEKKMEEVVEEVLGSSINQEENKE